MDAAVEHFHKLLSVIRTNGANPTLLDHVQVECYGTQTSLDAVANVLVPDKRNIIVRPFDYNILPEIEKALLKSKIGLFPVKEGKYIRLPIPILSEERRKALVKEASALAEIQRVAVRNIRRDAIKAYKATKDEKDRLIVVVDLLTKASIMRIDESLKIKCVELLGTDNQFKFGT